MVGIRQKLMLGFGGLLAVIVAIGTLTMAEMSALKVKSAGDRFFVSRSL